MSEVCGICFPQTQSTVTRLVHQNSGFRSRELVSEMRKGENRSLKRGEVQRVISSVHQLQSTGSGCPGAAVPSGGQRARDSRNEEMTQGNESSLLVQNTSEALPAPLVSQESHGRRGYVFTTKCAGGWLATLWFASPVSCQLRESGFVFVGTPKWAGCVQTLTGAGGLPELPNLEAELLCHSRFASLFPWEGEFVHLRPEMGVARSLSCLIQTVLTSSEGSGGPKHLSKRERPERWSPSPLEPQEFVSLLNHKG